MLNGAPFENQARKEIAERDTECARNPAFIRDADEHKQPIKVAFIPT